MGLHLSTLWEWWQWVEVHQMLEGSVRSRHVCACLCVSSTSTFCDCSVERMAWDIYGVRAALPCGWKTCCLQNWPSICFGLLTELRNGSIHLGRGAPFGVEFLDLSWWDGLVGLASGAVHGLDPQDSVLLVIAGKHHSVAFLHGVEEGPAAVQACCDSVGSSTDVSSGCAWLVCVAAKASSLHLAVGRCSPRCSHPAAAAPAVQTFSLCSCTWRTCTDLPATRGLHLINEAHCYF